MMKNKGKLKKMIYRDIKSGDIDGAYKVELSAFSEPWSLSSLREELNNKLSRYIIAEDENGNIIGYMGAWFIIDEAHITKVAVHKDYRGMGIGDGLLRNFVEKCVKEKICSMTLEVRASNIVAQNLYKKYGFVLGGIRKEYYNDNKEDALIMWKQLREVF